MPSCTRTRRSRSSTARPPAELVEEAERLGLHALAVTDHDGFYGIVRFAEAAEHLQVKTVFGAELSLGATTRRPDGVQQPAPSRNGPPIPTGRTCSCSPAARRVSPAGRGDHHAQLAGGEKGRPRYDLADLAERRTGTGRSSPDAARAPCARRWHRGRPRPVRNSTGSSTCSGATR
jgi:hypothetical protein